MSHQKQGKSFWSAERRQRHKNVVDQQRWLGEFCILIRQAIAIDVVDSASDRLERKIEEKLHECVCLDGNKE